MQLNSITIYVKLDVTRDFLSNIIFFTHQSIFKHTTQIFILSRLSVVFSSTAESFGVSAQIGSGVVRGGPQVRFHEGSTRVPPGFREGSTGLKRAPHAVGDITRAYFQLKAIPLENNLE